MSHKEKIIQRHYSVPSLSKKILTVLDTLEEKGAEILTPADLASVDEFHIRGREATIELAKRMELHSGLHVLDVGSGIGGSARHLAFQYGCRVIGMDVTESYCKAASILSDRLGLSNTTSFIHGNAVDMPFGDHQFDVVWTQHVQMNIEDKTRFYREIYRVLKPGGNFLFHDVFQGNGDPLHFPVPWAKDASISFLMEPNKLSPLLEAIGFRRIHWEDKTKASLAWCYANITKMKSKTSPAPGVHLLMGSGFKDRFANIVRNLEEGNVVVLQAVYEKV
jgi:ubiquinone/menaquinone biosynthesis C-methylase UbiE